MLWIIAVVLIALWLVGLVTEVVGGVIHVLLAIAAIIIIWNFISGRRTV